MSYFDEQQNMKRSPSIKSINPEFRGSPSDTNNIRKTPSKSPSTFPNTIKKLPPKKMPAKHIKQIKKQVKQVKLVKYAKQTGDSDNDIQNPSYSQLVQEYIRQSKAIEEYIHHIRKIEEDNSMLRLQVKYLSQKLEQYNEPEPVQSRRNTIRNRMSNRMSNRMVQSLHRIPSMSRLDDSIIENITSIFYRDWPDALKKKWDKLMDKTLGFEDTMHGYYRRYDRIFDKLNDLQLEQEPSAYNNTAAWLTARVQEMDYDRLNGFYTLYRNFYDQDPNVKKFIDAIDEGEFYDIFNNNNNIHNKSNIK
jgi:hypothetical protein